MNILHVVPAYEPQWHRGGVVRAVSSLCKGLVRLGHRVVVYAVEGEGAPASMNPVEQDGVLVYRFPVRTPHRWSFSPALAGGCRARMGEFDVVHLTSFWHFPGIAAGREARRRRIPYVMSPLGTFLPAALARRHYMKRLYLRSLELANLRGAAAFHYAADIERRRSRWCGFRRPSFVAPHAVEAAEPSARPSRREARKRLGLPDDAHVVAFLGRLHAVKALDRFLPAFASLARHDPRLRLVLAGPDAGHAGVLRRLAHDLSLDGAVSFPGMVGDEDKALLFAAADVGILVSHHENFGVAAAEFMAAGVPVLLSDQVCIAREVAADGAGAVVPIEGDKMAAALGDMLSDPRRLRRMAESARRSARERFGSEQTAKLMATAYEDILTGRRSAACFWQE